MNFSDSATQVQEEIRELARRLFRAENTSNGNQVAEELLAPDFLPIVRSKGRPDESRTQTVENFKIEKPSFARDVDGAAIDVTLFRDGTVAIAQTVLPTTDTTRTPPEVSYRNMHVFLRRNDHWQCVAWQVTAIQ